VPFSVLQTGPGINAVVRNFPFPPGRPAWYNPALPRPRSGRLPVYKYLLCTRYLRTRYLAFVCIVSVMLGVATLIVVNSVMSGFSNKLKDRLHGILSEVMVETDRADGFAEPPDAMIARIKASPVGEYVEAVSPTVETVAMLQFYVRDRTGQKVPIIKHVKLVGVDAAKHATVNRFKDYLTRQKDSAAAPSFDLTPAAKERHARNQWLGDWDAPPAASPLPPVVIPNVQPDPAALFRGGEVVAPPAPAVPPPALPAAAPPRLPGVVLGYGIGHRTYTDPATGKQEPYTLLREGDDVLLATVGAGGMTPVYGTFAVADFFKADMSDYDNSFVYVPLADLQQLRGMAGRVNSLQLRLRADVAGDEKFVHETIVPELRKLFPREDGIAVQSWQQHQGTLLAAIDIERGILNLLLFMIVGVAGFSVLAIFTMIVAEKYRDIGVLKSLGASNAGVGQIFLGYGLLLGAIGCGCGSAAGLLITRYINEIEGFLTKLTGQQIFDRSIYYFDQIPTNVEAVTVLLVNVGAVGIAVLSSVLPAARAARLHPVRALRFE